MYLVGAFISDVKQFDFRVINLWSGIFKTKKVQNVEIIIYLYTLVKGYYLYSCISWLPGFIFRGKNISDFP